MAQMSKIEKSISESFAEKEHSISLVNRSKMSLSGVNDVSEFSDSQVMLKTSMGGLCIKGKNLSINQLNTDTGMLDVKGEIHSIQYAQGNANGFKSVCGNSFCKRYIVLDICGICHKCGGVEFQQRNI